jgi:hypothetical protein
LAVEAAVLDGYEVVDRGGGLVGIGGVQYVKGWSRSTAFLFILAVLVNDAHLPMVAILRRDRPDIFASFCTQHAVVHNHSTVEARIKSAREITLGSTATRKKPNCFNYLFQAEKVMRATGSTADAMLARWSEVTAVSAILGMTREEGAATLNLIKNVPVRLRERLQRMAAKHGMFRGPVSHGILSSPLFGLDGGPDHPVDAWREGLRNGPAVLDLVVERLDDDYSSAPALMRKTPTLAEFGLLQQRCAAFELNVSLLRLQVNGDVFAAEQPKLRKKFCLHYMDTDLDEQVKQAAMPDPCCIPAFNDVIQNFTSQVEKERRDKHREFADRVAVATLAQLKLELLEDGHAADEHIAKVASLSSTDEKLDLAYTGTRYNKG